MSRLRLHLDRKRLIVIGAVVLVVALLGAAAAIAAGGGGDGSADDAQTPGTTGSSTTTSTTAPPIAPLTGLLADPALLRRPAIIVKVDNTPKALPVQEGIDRADVVVVEQVEGSATRLAAIFHSQNAEPGPIRSARTSDLAIARSFGLPLFTNSGGNAGVLEQVRRSDALIDAGINSSGAAAVFNKYKRNDSLLRFFVPIEALYEIREGEGRPPEPIFTFRPPGFVPAGEPSNGVDVTYGRGSTKVHYEWDGTGWARSQDGRPHEMANGGPRIAPVNVVVMSTTYIDSGYVDTGGNKSPEAVLEGEGEVLVFTAGHLVRGTWRGTDQGGKLSFVDGLGLPIALTPGQTFIELATPGGYVPF